MVPAFTDPQVATPALLLTVEGAQVPAPFRTGLKLCCFSSATVLLLPPSPLYVIHANRTPLLKGALRTQIRLYLDKTQGPFYYLGRFGRYQPKAPPLKEPAIARAFLFNSSFYHKEACRSSTICRSVTKTYSITLLPQGAVSCNTQGSLEDAQARARGRAAAGARSQRNGAVLGHTSKRISERAQNRRWNSGMQLEEPGFCVQQGATSRLREGV